MRKNILNSTKRTTLPMYDFCIIHTNEIARFSVCFSCSRYKHCYIQIHCGRLYRQYINDIGGHTLIDRHDQPGAAYMGRKDQQEKTRRR